MVRQASYCDSPNSAFSAGCQPRDGFGKIEQRCFLALAEILRLKKLGETNDLCASTRRFTNLLDSVLEVFLRIRRSRHLCESHAKFLRWHEEVSFKPP